MVLLNIRHILLITFAFTLLGVISACSVRTLDSLDLAEQSFSQEKWEDAIRHYQAHMSQRERVPNRAAWENPKFYYLLVGDAQLELKQPEEALKSYLIAEEQGNEKIGDRIRNLARWYEQRTDTDRAIRLLTQFRERDPLLFDGELDRLYREITIREDLNN